VEGGGSEPEIYAGLEKSREKSSGAPPGKQAAIITSIPNRKSLSSNW
jgi:hypothetical protein